MSRGWAREIERSLFCPDVIPRRRATRNLRRREQMKKQISHCARNEFACYQYRIAVDTFSYPVCSFASHPYNRGVAAGGQPARRGAALTSKRAFLRRFA